MIQKISVDFAQNRRCFLGTLKGLLSCFKSQKTDNRILGPKKHWALFYVTCAAKKSEGRCDIAPQPMCRYAKCRHRSCNKTYVTNLKKEFFYSLESILAMSLHLRWQHLTYRNMGEMSRTGANLGADQFFKVIPFLISLRIKVRQRHNVLLSFW